MARLRQSVIQQTDNLEAPYPKENPVRILSRGQGKYEVRTPHGVKAKGTTMQKAKKQANLLRAIEHGFKPTGR